MKVFLVAFAVYIVLAFVTGEYLAEADSDARLANVRYALKNPSALLDPWNKPVLTTLAAVVVKLGGDAVELKILQGLMAALALALIHAACLKAGAPAVPSLCATALAGLAPFWVRGVASMLTEISCALFLAAALLLWTREKFALAALAVSFSFMARFEGLFFALAVAPFLFRKKNWLALAMLPVAPLLWHLAGWAATGDLKYLLSHEPHPVAHSIYGRGPWWTFLALLPVSAGVLVIPAIAGLKRAPPVAVAIAAVTLAGHTFLWAFGLMGSFGMPRYLVTIIPALALPAAFGLERFPVTPRILLFSFAAAAATFVALYRPNTWRGARELAGMRPWFTDSPTVARFCEARAIPSDPPSGATIAWEPQFAPNGEFEKVPKDRLSESVYASVSYPGKWPWEKLWVGKVYRVK